MYRGTCSSPFSPSIFQPLRRPIHPPTLSPPLLDSYAPFTLIVLATFPTGLTLKEVVLKFSSHSLEIYKFPTSIYVEKSIFLARIKSDNCLKTFEIPFLFLFCPVSLVLIHPFIVQLYPLFSLFSIPLLL